jgi:hypothetical protein
VLTDLEIDVLYLLERDPEFGGAWRLPKPPFDLAPGESYYQVAVAIHDSHTRLAALVKLLAVEDSGRVMLFDPAIGTPSPLRRGTPISLSSQERERGRARSAEAREKTRTALPDAPAPLPTPLPTALVLLVTRDVWSARQLEGISTLIVRRAVSMRAAADYMDINTPELTIVDLDVEGAAEFAEHLAHNDYPERVVFFGEPRSLDARRGDYFPKPITAIIALRLASLAHSKQRIVPVVDALPAYLGEPPPMLQTRPEQRRVATCAPTIGSCTQTHGGACIVASRAYELMRQLVILVVDPVGELTRLVRESMPRGVRVTRARDGWEALERVEAQRIDWVLCDETSRPNADESPPSDVRGPSLLAALVKISPDLAERVLFATTRNHKARLRHERPKVAHRFFAVPFDPAAMRARLLA